jgi:hypothetical protein
VCFVFFLAPEEREDRLASELSTELGGVGSSEISEKAADMVLSESVKVKTGPLGAAMTQGHRAWR